MDRVYSVQFGLLLFKDQYHVMEKAGSNSTLVPKHQYSKVLLDMPIQPGLVAQSDWKISWQKSPLMFKNILSLILSLQDIFIPPPKPWYDKDKRWPGQGLSAVVTSKKAHGFTCHQLFVQVALWSISSSSAYSCLLPPHMHFADVPLHLDILIVMIVVVWLCGH